MPRMITVLDVRPGKAYEFKTSAGDKNFHAIVKLKTIDGAIKGDVIYLMKNTINWKLTDLALGTQDFIKEITEDKNPEYFL